MRAKGISLELRHAALVLATSLSLSACGGGGGSGSGTTVQPPPPPPPPRSELPMTPDNDSGVADEAGMALHTVFQLGKMIFNRSVELSDSGDFQSLEDCNLGGTVTTEFDDADGNGEPSTGDKFTVTYADACLDKDLNNFLTGQASFTVTDWIASRAGSLATGRVEIESPIKTSGNGESRPVSLSGGMDILAYNVGQTRILEVSIPDGEEFTNRWYSIYEPALTYTSKISNFTVRQEYRTDEAFYTGYEFDLQFDIDSDLVDGTFSCTTTSPMRGRGYSVPDVDEFFECNGANDSAVRVAFIGEIQPFVEGVEVSVDADGDGTFIATGFGSAGGINLEWLFLRFTDSFNTPSDTFVLEPIANERLEFSITDSAFHQATNRLYVISDAELVVLDGASLAELDRTTLPGIASTMTITDDGTRLWIATRGEPRMRSYDSQTLEVVRDFTFVSQPPQSATLDHVTDIKVMPGSTDFLVAMLGHRREIVAFNAGVELPGVLATSFPFSDAFAITETGQLVTALASQARPAPLYTGSIDIAAGLSIDAELPGYVGTGPLKEITTDGRTVYIRGGRVIDLDRLMVVGELLAFGNVVGDFTVDSQRNKIYTFAGSSKLYIYQKTPRTLLSGYSLDLYYLGDIRRVHLGDEYLLVTTAERVVQLSLDDLVPSVRQDNNCSPKDLSGLLLPGRAILLDCLVNAAQYDAVRDNLLVSLSMEEGEKGGSIAVIDPQTAAIEEMIPLGSEPGRMRITADGQSLLVSLPNANEMAVIDLALNEVSRLLPLGYHRDSIGDPVGPALSTAVAPANGNIDNFIAAFDSNEVALYTGGVRASDEATAPGRNIRPYVDVFLSANEDQAVAIGLLQSDYFDVTPNGVNHLADLGTTFYTNPLQEIALSQRGDELFAFTGDIFDISTGTISHPCPVGHPGSRHNLAVPELDPNRFTFLSIANVGISLQTCNRSTGEVIENYPVGSLGAGDDSFVAGFHTPAGLLIIVMGDMILIIDAPTSNN